MYVLDPLTQRRNLDRKDRQTVIEVLPEPAVLDRFLEIDVRRGDDADIGLDDLFAADPCKLSVLQNAKQIDLRRQRHLADFIEEKRAAARFFETALTLRTGIGEGAFLVSEQLGLEQRFRDRAAVDLDVWLVFAA